MSLLYTVSHQLACSINPWWWSVWAWSEQYISFYGCCRIRTKERKYSTCRSHLSKTHINNVISSLKLKFQMLADRSLDLRVLDQKFRDTIITGYREINSICSVTSLEKHVSMWKQDNCFSRIHYVCNDVSLLMVFILWKF